MSKRVTFSPTNIVYGPTPATPSPSLSFSSLASSSPEISTPPPEEENYSPTLYHSINQIEATPYPSHLELTPYIPAAEYPSPEPLTKPVLPSQPIHIHRLLGFHPMGEPGIFYDVSLPPEALVDQLPLELLAEPATSPPFPSLAIRFPFGQHTVEIYPAQNVGYVSVFDILYVLHRELRSPITPAEYAYLPEGVVKQGVDAAYFSRCARIHDPVLHEKEKLKGIKLVDFLMGRTRFMGLSGTLAGPNVWELNVS